MHTFTKPEHRLEIAADTETTAADAVAVWRLPILKTEQVKARKGLERWLASQEHWVLLPRTRV